jgi:hypothetical protein
MKMRRSIRGSLFLMGACLFAGMGAWAQASNAVQQSRVSTDLAVTYSLERSEQAPGDCGCFWLQGGGADASAVFYKGLGMAVALDGDHASNVAPGVDVNMILYLAGPRYSRTLPRPTGGRTKAHPAMFFGQFLIGGVYAFNGVFPAGSSTVPSANALAIQAGGGVNLALTPRLGLRLFEAEYQRTYLPNNAANTQNDLRIAAGLSLRFGKR